MEILPFLAIVSEVDLGEAYIPFIYEPKQLKIIQRNMRIGYSKTYIPLMKDR
jgi:hypothetical protein